ncbi:MAG: hypothetical protein AB7L84_06585 [Acidimicrobiia bacterium]
MRATGRFMAVLFGALVLVLPGGAASAQTCPNAGHAGIVECPKDPGPKVDRGSSEKVVKKAAPTRKPVEVLGVQVTRGSLPVTGSDVAALSALAVTAIVGGVTLTTMSRRRHRA